MLKSLILFTCCVTALFAGLGYYEYSLWQECRSDHSWLYCLRVLQN